MSNDPGCAICGEPISVLDWAERHSPNADPTKDVHARCCPDCEPDEVIDTLVRLDAEQKLCCQALGLKRCPYHLGLREGLNRGYETWAHDCEEHAAR